MRKLFVVLTMVMVMTAFTGCDSPITDHTKLTITTLEKSYTDVYGNVVEVEVGDEVTVVEY